MFGPKFQTSFCEWLAKERYMIITLRRNAIDSIALLPKACILLI